MSHGRPAGRRPRRPATLALVLLAAGCGGGGSEAPSAVPGRSLAPTDPAYLDHRAAARELYEQGELRKALRESAIALTRSPGTAEASEAVSRIYSELGRDDEAVEFFTLAAEKFPRSAPVRLYLGEHRFRLGDWDTALAAYEDAIRLDPQDPEAPFRRGVILQAHARFEEALHAFRRSYELDPSSAVTAARVARLQRITGDYDGARATVEGALLRLPGAPELRYALGQLELRDGDLVAAEASFRQALASDPRHREAHFDLGRLLRRTGRAREGLRHERTARRLSEFLETRERLNARLAGGDPEVPLALGELELSEDAFRTAQRWFDRAEALGADAARVAAGRAAAWFGLGRPAQAQEALSGLPASDPRAALSRAAGALAAGHRAEFESLAAEVALAAPDRESLRRLADLYGRAGLEGRADTLLERAESAPSVAEPILDREHGR